MNCRGSRCRGALGLLLIALAVLLVVFSLRLIARWGAKETPAATGSLRAIAWAEIGKLPRDPEALSLWASALENSAVYYDKQPAAARYAFGSSAAVSAAALARGCRDLATRARGGNIEALHAHLRAHYRVFAATGRDGHGEVLVTGYYEPLLEGSRTRSERFRHPLYQRPDDLLEADLGAWSEDLKGRKLVARVEKGKLLPYFDRTEIDQDGRLAGRGLEVVWVDDEIALFFLHIQGSGRIRLAEDGSHLRVGYAAANGRPYRAIGSLMLKEGMLTPGHVSMQAIRSWLEAHPGEVERVLAHNPSYVFFREQAGGPFGNIEVALTPGHSIATDYREFPKGAPALLVSRWPRFAQATGEEIAAWEPVTRWVVNQDTGGAIRGPGRVDWFMGFGAEAERVAGVMKADRSALYFIAPRDD
ncbi:MAG: murein transglycosylase A [Magnetococcales bacterium]|nr:murein transglycosylase A [Magnetococcales bacterium]